MSKLNNKAQTLVAFIILLPIICLVIILFLEKLYLYSEKENLKSIANLICIKSENGENFDTLKKLALANDSKITNFKIEVQNANTIIELSKTVKVFTDSYNINEKVTCK